MQLDLVEVIERREILVVNGAKGAVGEDNAILFLQLLILTLQKALHRVQQQEVRERVPCAVVIDEAHNLFTPSFATMLSESRSAGLEAVCAFQYTGQITDDRVRAGIKSLLQSISIFRMREFDDARAVASLAMEVYADMIGDDPDAQRRLRIDPVDIVQQPTWRCLNLWIANANPQAPFTAHTLPVEAARDRLGTEGWHATHAARQAERGWHPHDHDEPIVPPSVWSEHDDTKLDGTTLTVDLTHRYADGLHPADDVFIVLDGPAGRTAWPAQSADRSRRRYEVRLPAPGPDPLPPGAYTVRAVVRRHGQPDQTVALTQRDGDDEHPAEVVLANTRRPVLA